MKTLKAFTLIRTLYDKNLVKVQRGFTLIEVLIVLSLFALLTVLLTQSLILTLRSTRKSENLRIVKEDMDYAVSVMERHIHNALAVDSPCISPTPTPPVTSILYRDDFGTNANFSCLDVGIATGRIASSSGTGVSARTVNLTSEKTKITECNFVCNLPSMNGTELSSLDLTLKGESAGTQGAEGGTVDINAKIYLRTY